MVPVICIGSVGLTELGVTSNCMFNVLVMVNASVLSCVSVLPSRSWSDAST
ncbi:hypothetical protein HN592_04280 [Candidatus Woesearchaeota archaeon]|nr:hypothetical protein [Candidatus Woesearchaeota archaeon]MBT4368430.1 hypothetical protein [Candidatus Woesearchaeota archaeon]MBT4712919.1 hypothetical protein [Candidatus Woesearchaeota archaeon]MBT6639831.1 hypothetical protein [Candidatus Woesearchaeota archaeon]MBT7134003.1 hypothetical protein [Candidatus Woesearchaeota archaeon]